MPFIFFILNISSLFISYLIITWRETIFIKQLKNFGINKLTFLLSLFVVYLIYSLGVLIIILSIFLSIDKIRGTSMVIDMFVKLFSSASVVMVIFNIFLMIIYVYLTSILISGFLRNIYIVQSLMILFLLFTLFTSDALMDLKFYNSTFYQIISYLNPQKYFNWIFYIAYTNSWLGGQNLFKIVNNIDIIIAFKNIFVPLFSMIILLSTISLLSYYSFNISLRK
ncbi:hypothetical protein [Spiroplasma turonicum]|nr:hypothetical protein [Spiroplasma turonicum]